MKKVLNKVSDILNLIILVICTLLCGFLAITAFLFTSYANDMAEQKMLYTFDNVLITILSSLILVGIGIIIYRLVMANPKKRLKVFLYIVAAFYLLAGIFLVFWGRTVAGADAMSVYQMAKSVASGSLDVISGQDSYLSYYPQQIGLMTFFAIICRFADIVRFPIEAFHLIKLIYSVFIAITVIVQFKLIMLVGKKEPIGCIFLLLSLVNYPLIMYSSFFYGEIPSLLCISFAFFFLYKYINQQEHISKSRYGWANFVLGVLFTGLSVWLRKNSLIIVIAICIVLFIKMLETSKVGFGALLLCIAIISIGILPLTQASYEKAAGRKLLDGVTMYSYLAMGMQEASRGPGWYNGFNYQVYEESGFDKSVANEISQNAIEERLAEFKNDLNYTSSFYFHKYLSQWTDGTYASCQATQSEYGGRLAIVQSLYTGNLYTVYWKLMSICQNLIYIGALLWCLFEYKNKSRDIVAYAAIIAVIGGFIFHMMWEANSRYIFTYGQLLIPYASAGIYSLANRLKGSFGKKMSKKL